MPWPHFLALAAKASQLNARELYHAMRSMTYALAYHDGDTAAKSEFDRLGRRAYPGMSDAPTFALKQSD